MLRTVLAEESEYLTNMLGGQGAARIDVHLEETAARRIVEDKSFGAFPEMEGDMAGLYRRDTRHAFIKSRLTHVVNLGGREVLHVDGLDELVDQAAHLSALLGIRACAGLAADN